MQFVFGSEVDYVEGLQGAGFAVNNPNVVAACGCGSSFQVREDEIGKQSATVFLRTHQEPGYSLRLLFRELPRIQVTAPQRYNRGKRTAKPSEETSAQDFPSSELTFNRVRGKRDGEADGSLGVSGLIFFFFFFFFFFAPYPVVITQRLVRARSEDGEAESISPGRVDLPRYASSIWSGGALLRVRLPVPLRAARGTSSGYPTPSVSASSPEAYISSTMSQPPTSSPSM